MFDLLVNAQLGLSDFDAHLSYVTKTGNRAVKPNEHHHMVPSDGS